MRFLIGVGTIFLGLIGILLFRYIQIRSVPSFTPQPSTFTLQPPAQAITATLSQSTGVVEQFTRQADDYQEATPGGIIHHGESIATKRGAATITLANLGIVSLRDDAEISFVNLIPDSLMFLHTAGVIDYKTHASIRALHALVELAGDATISVDAPIVKILVTSGTAKIALVDNENNTNVWNFVQSQSAIVNDETRTIVYSF